MHSLLPKAQMGGPGIAPDRGRPTIASKPVRPRLAFANANNIAIAAVVLFGLALRLYHLGAPYDRGGYDEGVYWESLRLFTLGHALYREIFYSQPPFFLLSVASVYLLFGASLWSARLGIVLLSMMGMAGAGMIGKALAGRAGMFASMLLFAVDPEYLAQSQMVVAEPVCVAFSLLAVGSALLWWRKPNAGRANILAGLSGGSLACAILSKFLAAAIALPLASIALLAAIWVVGKPVEDRRLVIRGVLTAGAAFAVVFVAILIPFAGGFQQMVAQTIGMHLASKAVYTRSFTTNLELIAGPLKSWLGVAAMYGLLLGCLGRKRAVIPCVTWLAGTVLVLFNLMPLFPQHVIILRTSLLALAIFAIGNVASRIRKPGWGTTMRLGYMLGFCVLGFVFLHDLKSDVGYLRDAQAGADLTPSALLAFKDLDTALLPDEQVITDAQFVAAKANRNTPPALADTSIKRIKSGFLTSSELIADASKPNVRAVLLLTGRLSISQTAKFDLWVKRHFVARRLYGVGQVLYVKPRVASRS